MKVYLLGTLFLLALHQAAAQGLFGASNAEGGGEAAEGGGGAGGEGGTRAGGGLLALFGGSAVGGAGGEEEKGAEGGAPGNPMKNVLIAYLLQQRMQRMHQMQQMKRMQQIQRMQEAQRALQAINRGDPHSHDHFSWSGALMRAYLLDRVMELIGGMELFGS